MKKYIIIFVSVFFYISVIYSQEINSLDIPKYEKAYEYIRNDSINKGKALYISNLVLDMYRSPFSEIVKSYPKYEEKLENLYKINNEDDFYSHILKDIFYENNLKKYLGTILFFSTIEENTLMGSIFLNANKIYQPAEYCKLTYSNFWFHPDKNYMYLFFFDKENNIEKVFCTEFYGL